MSKVIYPGKGRDAATKQFSQLLEHCRFNMDQLEKELPAPAEDFREVMKFRGVSRRDFIKWTTAMTAALMLPPMFRPMVARAAENFGRIPVVWISLAECTGCLEGFLRTSYPAVEDVLFETISLEYQENLMAAAGYQAEQNLEKCVADFPGKFICIVEGAVQRGLAGNYLRIGPKGRTGVEIVRDVAPKAAAVICMGSCAAFGNVPAARPNPTEAVGVAEALGIRTVNISGCPPNGVNLMGTLLYYIMLGALPPLDSLGRPVWAFGQRIHDLCERRSHYDAGEYVEQWGDDAARKGWCLYKMGCKGPYTHGNCPRLRYNDMISWPVMGGHGCIGCFEPGFWDSMAPLEEPLHEGGIAGTGITIDEVGLALTGITAAGIAAHAVASVIREKRESHRSGEKPGEDGNGE
jgi:quinone-reactive Ni/Fe-hydrogenase small subunit